jgi:hypothetical protein
MTGLEEEFVRRAGGRLETGAYLREVFREGGKIGSIYDSNVTGYDPYPFAAERRTDDPMLESIIAPTTTAMVDFVTRVGLPAYRLALVLLVQPLLQRGEVVEDGGGVHFARRRRSSPGLPARGGFRPFPAWRFRLAPASLLP